jgi:hypothetical protein
VANASPCPLCEHADSERRKRFAECTEQRTVSNDRRACRGR